MDIKLAVSRSGHDKDSIYVIVREEADMVYLADGSRRSVEQPKRKNKKHIQLIKKLPKEVTEVFTQEDFQNEEIKRAIKLYQRNVEYQEEAKCQKQMLLK